MLINLFAPNPSRADFARLKAALNRKDDRIGQLESELKHKKSNTFDDIYSRIVAVTLYKAIAQQNVELCRKNKELRRDVIDRFIEIGFGFHLGTSDLRIDFTPVGSVKTYNCLMLLGGKNYVSFQPSELYKLAEVCGKSSSIIDRFLNDIRLYLSNDNKHKPYELVTGYYNISHDTLLNNITDIAIIFTRLIGVLRD